MPVFPKWKVSNDFSNQVWRKLLTWTQCHASLFALSAVKTCNYWTYRVERKVTIHQKRRKLAFQMVWHVPVLWLLLTMVVPSWNSIQNKQELWLLIKELLISNVCWGVPIKKIELPHIRNLLHPFPRFCNLFEDDCRTAKTICGQNQDEINPLRTFWRPLHTN